MRLECRRFDATIGGYGTYPYAQDVMVGNLATETLLATLKDLGAELPEIEPLDYLVAMSAEMGEAVRGGDAVAEQAEEGQRWGCVDWRFAETRALGTPYCAVECGDRDVPARWSYLR